MDFSPSRVLPLLALAAMACGQEKLVNRPEAPPKTDKFEQIKASSIDILFVVDNSGSMKPYQEALSANFARFMEIIDPDPSKRGEDGEVDYRLAIATTDVENQAGQLQGQPAIIQPGPSAIADFERNVIVGTKGAAYEQAFRAADLALEAAGKMTDGSGNKAFLRDKAFLYLIFVTDEEERSFGETRYFHRRFESLKGLGNENTVLASAIAGPVPDGCAVDEFRGAEAGVRFDELARLTGGVVGSICTADWSATLRQLAFTGLGLRKRFQLSLPVKVRLDQADDTRVDPETFKYLAVHYPCTTEDDDPRLAECGFVERRCSAGEEMPGVACTPWWDPHEENGVYFDRRENSLVFWGASVPGPGATIWATYDARE